MKTAPLFACAGVLTPLLAVAGLAWLDRPLYAAAQSLEQHFAPAENLEAIDVALIESAGERIEMAAYVLTDFAVIEALTDAAARGVKVRVYRSHDERAPNGRLADAMLQLTAAGADVRTRAADAPLMHLKAYCVDGRALRFGAANFSHSGLTEQDNDLDIARGASACDRFEAAFARLWANSE